MEGAGNRTISPAGASSVSAFVSRTCPESGFCAAVTSSAQLVESTFTTSQLSTNEVQGSSGSVCNSAYLFDATQVIWVRRQDPQIVLDRSRLFNSDQSELRATMRGDLIVPNPTSVVRLTGLLPLAPPRGSSRTRRRSCTSTSSPGRTVVLADGCSYGDRATLQVLGAVAHELLAAGNVEEVDPSAVPDVAER